MLGFLSLLLALLPAVSSPDWTKDFDEGVAAYRRGDYASAETLWKEALRAPELEAFDRAAITRNLGNAAWRQARGLEAVAWYTASLRSSPRDAETWASLEHARQASELEPADRGDLTSTLRRIVESWTPAEAQWMVAGATFLWLLALIGEALRGGIAWRVAAWSGFFLVAVAALPLIWHLRGADREVWMVVERDVELASEPRADLGATGAVEPAQEVIGLDQVPDWVRIETAGGARGWVPRESVMPLTPLSTNS